MSHAPVLKNRWTVTEVDMILLVVSYEKVVRDAAVSLVSVDALGDKDAVRPCLVVSVTEAVRRGVFLCVSSPWGAVLVSFATCFHGRI